MIQNKPLKVHSCNLADAYVEVSEIYLWIQLKKHARKLQFRIDAVRLWNQMLRARRTNDYPIYVGDLDLFVETDEVMGERVVVLKPNEEKEEAKDAPDQFWFEISLPLREFEHVMMTLGNPK